MSYGSIALLASTQERTLVTLDIIVKCCVHLPRPASDNMEPSICLSIVNFLGLSFISLVVLRYIYTTQNCKRLPLPPGPRGLPLFGNIFEIPTHHYWLKFDEWVREHGPICSISILGKRVIILGSAQVAADLLDRRSAKYSDRPRWVLASEILARNKHVGVMRIGNDHRRFRRAIHAGLQPRALTSYHALEEKEAETFIAQVLRAPEDFRNSIKRYAVSLVLKTTFGHQVTDFKRDRFATRIYKSSAIFAGSLAPGAFLVDILPWLRNFPAWFPGAGWQLKAAEWAESDRVLYTEMLEAARTNSANSPSFISEGLGDPGYGVDEDELAYIGGIISQTSDTLMSVCSVFVLAMTRWPEIQRKAQEEIDSYVGRSRLPLFIDREHLPYTTAIVKETCRWRPVAPLGVPHATTEDDEYMGYFIPRGTTVVGSIWSIHQDASVYPDPTAFLPERFLDADGKEKNTEESKNFGHHMFGFGRRFCPGATMADHAVWIFVARCLWALEILPPSGSDGRQVIPDVSPLGFSSGGEASHPLPFACDIRGREGVSRTILDNQIYPDFEA
ncbi:cytochrome P450 [Mycena galericulata]|nr:cytochrome P450 [Mycena galericulata]